MSTSLAPDTYDDLFPPPPATGLTDADLRALWHTADGRAWRVAWQGLTDEEYRAFLAAFDHVDYPDEDDDGPIDAAAAE